MCVRSPWFWLLTRFKSDCFINYGIVCDLCIGTLEKCKPILKHTNVAIVFSCIFAIVYTCIPWQHSFTNIFFPCFEDTCSVKVCMLKETKSSVGISLIFITNIDFKTRKQSSKYGLYFQYYA